MEIHKVQGTGDETAKRWYFDWNQQWTSLLGGCNWYDWTLIKIQGEFAPYSDRWEIELGLFGFTGCITYLYSDRFNKKMRGRMDAFKADLAARTGCEVIDPTGALDDSSPVKEG